MDLKKIVKAARDQGWREDRTKSNHHLRLTPSDKTKRPCTYSSTPSDVKGIRNFLSCLRQNGLVWPPPGKGQR